MADAVDHGWDDDDPVAIIARRVRDDDWAYRLLEALAGKGARPPGSAAARGAAVWMGEQLKQVGLDRVHEEPFPLTGWQRGREAVTVTAGAEVHALVATALGCSVSTTGDGIEGEAVLFASLDELHAATPEILDGKIAVVTARMARAEGLDEYVRAVPIRLRGASEAAKRGAVGFLMRSLTTNEHRLPHTGMMFYDAAAPRIPAGALSNPDADLIERLAELGPVRLRIVFESQVAPVEGVNLVAELTGGERPEEVVLLGAHLDSWDVGTGSLDDGVGVAVVAAVGRIVARLPRRPRRTIRIVLFGAEEYGISGTAYAERQAGREGAIAIACECDFGAGRILRAALPGTTAQSALGRRIAAVLSAEGVALSAAAASSGGPDLEPLARRGVPMLDLSQDGSTYFDYNHSTEDTFDKVDPADLAHLVLVWSQLAWMLADSDVDFRA